MKLNNLPRDTYQDLLLPDRTEKGFKDTEKTWDNIKGEVDFRNKIVLDIGCNSGYFMLQALFSGCIKAIGVDLNGTHFATPAVNIKKPFEIAEDVFNKWELSDKIVLIEGDWMDAKIDDNIDIVLCLSVSHYFKDLENGLRKIFDLQAGLLIFEAHPITISTLLILALEYNYITKTRINSHWNSYEIIKLQSER